MKTDTRKLKIIERTYVTLKGQSRARAQLYKEIIGLLRTSLGNSDLNAMHVGGRLFLYVEIRRDEMRSTVPGMPRSTFHDTLQALREQGVIVLDRLYATQCSPLRVSIPEMEIELPPGVVVRKAE